MSEDLLSIAAAARALTAAGDEISRQGLSKYCANHGLIRDTDRGHRVSLSAVRAHRAQNYQREVMSGGVHIPEAPAPAAPVPTPQSDSPAAPPPSNVVTIPDTNDPSRRLKQLQVEEQEIELARLRGEVVLADEVTAGVTDIVVMLRQQLFQAIPASAKELASELSLGPEDERLIRAAMKASARQVLSNFVAAAAQANAALAGESASDMRARINALSLAAARMRRRPEQYLSALEARAG